MTKDYHKEGRIAIERLLKEHNLKFKHTYNESLLIESPTEEIFSELTSHSPIEMYSIKKELEYYGYQKLDENKSLSLLVIYGGVDRSVFVSVILNGKSLNRKLTNVDFYLKPKKELVVKDKKELRITNFTVFIFICAAIYSIVVFLGNNFIVDVKDVLGLVFSISIFAGISALCYETIFPLNISEKYSKKWNKDLIKNNNRLKTKLFILFGNYVFIFCLSITFLFINGKDLNNKLISNIEAIKSGTIDPEWEYRKTQEGGYLVSKSFFLNPDIKGLSCDEDTFGYKCFFHMKKKAHD